MARFCDRHRETKSTTTTKRHEEKNIRAGEDGNYVTITGTVKHLVATTTEQHITQQNRNVVIDHQTMTS